jgi:hypothetical protein
MIRFYRYLAATVTICAFIISVHAFSAETNNLVGAWRGAFIMTVNNIQIPIEVELIVGPNRDFSALQRSPNIASRHNGTYSIIDENVISFEVLDWEPKKMQKVHSRGSDGGLYYTEEPVIKPAGGMAQYWLVSPDTLVVKDQFGIEITYTRVR